VQSIGAGIFQPLEVREFHPALTRELFKRMCCFRVFFRYTRVTDNGGIKITEPKSPSVIDRSSCV
jgi:hypothetical protein